METTIFVSWKAERNNYSSWCKYHAGGYRFSAEDTDIYAARP
jgi:hypothetical protein